jgi:DNA-binding response OmpR family regulator
MNSVEMQAAARRAVRVLVIEDEPMIALGLKNVLMQAGFSIAGVANKLDKALVLIEAGACDAAIVDANLAGVSAAPAAEALTARGLPFVVLSGYLPEQMQGVFSGTFLQKPCRPERMIATLSALCAGLSSPTVTNPSDSSI